MPLADFAISKLGWSIVKDKGTTRDLVLDHPTHGRTIVPTRPKSFNRRWVYSFPIGRGVEH
jgi:predicted RNA binding protein YcfA (HicA-like mRNA interferase family)